MASGWRERDGLYAVADVHYGDGVAAAAVVLARDAEFARPAGELIAAVPGASDYQPGEFWLRELPALCAALAQVADLGLLVVDGYADLDPAGKPGLGARARAEFDVPVIGIAKTRYRTATHAIEVLRGKSARPLYVTASGMPRAEAASLVRRMTGSYRLPDPVRRADALARAAARQGAGAPGHEA